MDIRTILLVLLFFVLLGWVVFWGVQFFRSGVKVVADGEFTGHIKCEICGTEYEVSAGEFTKSIMAKSVRTTKTRIQNGAFVNRPHYSYYAKKFSCPHCRKRRYGQVLNINELQKKMLKPSIRAGVKWLVFMAVGGVLILGVFWVPMRAANRAAKERADEMRQERYEDLKDKYGIE